jgi:hypothetical protein
MKLLRGLSSITVVGLLSMAVWTPHAMAAGHDTPVLEALLNGFEEVPTGSSNADGVVGDPNGRGAAYVFGVGDDSDTLCYTLVDVRRVGELDQAPGNGRAAHIHEGRRGTNGPIVVNLAWPQDGQAANCVTEGEEGAFPTGEADIVQRIFQNPTEFYVNVHNSEYPSGAIRGQLVNTQEPQEDDQQ